MLDYEFFDIEPDSGVNVKCCWIVSHLPPVKPGAVTPTPHSITFFISTFFFAMVCRDESPFYFMLRTPISLRPKEIGHAVFSIAYHRYQVFRWKTCGKNTSHFISIRDPVIPGPPVIIYSRCRCAKIDWAVSIPPRRRIYDLYTCFHCQFLGKEIEAGGMTFSIDGKLPYGKHRDNRIGSDQGENDSPLASGANSIPWPLTGNTNLPGKKIVLSTSVTHHWSFPNEHSSHTLVVHRRLRCMPQFM